MKRIIFLMFLCFITYKILPQSITGNLEGRIIDSLGTPLGGVNILLESENLQGIRGSSSDINGYFHVLALPTGKYKVEITMVGFQKVVYTDIHILLGSTTSLGTIILQQKSIETNEVIVSGNKVLIDPNSTAYGGTLRSKDFENLPIERNYQNIISLLPQANLSYYGDGVNIGGSTGFENKYFVDGVEVSIRYLMFLVPISHIIL